MKNDLPNWNKFVQLVLGGTYRECRRGEENNSDDRKSITFSHSVDVKKRSKNNEQK